jgi:hypothetical protein
MSARMIVGHSRSIPLKRLYPCLPRLFSPFTVLAVMKMPGLANKNKEYSVQFEFQTDSK